MNWVEEVDARRPQVSPELLKLAMPGCPDLHLWADQLSDSLEWAGIHDQSEVALFLAQVGHESSDLTRLEESMNYSVGGLLKTFGRHRISDADARKYGRRKGHPADQEAIATLIYGGEWGADNLGNTQPGDGYLYIGRGPIQLTGRYNYQRCADATGLDIIINPGALSSIPRYGAMSAAWFWLTHVTQGGDIVSTTRDVNGGKNGLADRTKRYQRIVA